TYREAEAFVWAANAAVESVDARMYGQAFLPGGEDGIIADWTDPNARAIPNVAISIPASEQVRFRVFDPRGVPVFETHKGREDDAARTTTIFLPANQAYEIDMLGADASRLDHRKLEPSGGHVAFAQIPRGAIGKATRGVVETSLEKGLFRRPYDARLFDDYRRFKEDDPDAAWFASRDGALDEEDDGGTVRALPFVLGGAAVAAIGTGVVFNVLSRAEYERAEDMCNGSTSSTCTVSSGAAQRELQDHIDTAKRQRAISYVGFGVGGAALVG